MSKSQKVFILFFITFQIKSVRSESMDELQVKVKHINRRSEQLYGHYVADDTRTYKEWELEQEDKLAYPRGKREKISELSSMWSRYYECTLERHRRLVDRRMPSQIIMVYEGAVARLTCGLCLSPEDVATWMYAASASNLTFAPMEQKDTVVTERDGNVTIYHVTSDDAGVYRCQVGDSFDGLVFVEVVDTEENYTVVKPLESAGPHPAAGGAAGARLLLHTAWSAWSECSACGRVGRRRRFGICTVTVKDNGGGAGAGNSTAYDAALDVFTEFPGGIPCRSRYLPEDIRNMTVVQRRPSEIMIGLCKVPCNNSVVFETRDAGGEVTERANNSAGVYSLLQPLPPQPPPPPGDVLFVREGGGVTVRCPGTTLVDVPVSWRVGAARVCPRELCAESEGRLYINARDHLVIKDAQLIDDNLYSCWQGARMCGRVQVRVWRDMWRCEPRSVLVALMLVLLFITKALYRLHTRKLAV